MPSHIERRLKRPTAPPKGALRYQEVDEKGEAIEQAWAKIGTLYVRKNAFERGAAFPPALRHPRSRGALSRGLP
jgi:hypothetical protein